MDDTANPSPGAESLSVDDAAQRISGILEPVKKEPIKKEEEQPEPAQAEATESEEPQAEVQTQEAETPAEPELSFQSLQELAEALEVPMEKLLGNVKARVKVAGEERDVTLEELRNGYQMESDYRRKTSELSEQRKAFEADRERVAHELNARMNEAQRMGQFMEQQLMAEYNSIDWNALRATNPAEWAAAKQDYNERYSQIQRVKQGVAQELQRQHIETQQKTREGLNKLLAEEKAKLVHAIPEFADETKAKALTQELRGFLKNNGFADSDIANIYDHRHVKIIRDAMQFRALQNKKAEVTNKVREAPKLLKPNAKPSNEQLNTEARRERLARLKKSGRVEDAASLIKDFIKV